MNKKILDVCCGGRMFYFNKNDPRVLFCDIREEETTLCDGRKFSVKPDIKCDFTNLPFEDNNFKLVVFDPPHLLRNAEKTKKITGYQMIKYGALYSDWAEMLKQGFNECFRVLEENGILIFKWNETDIKVNEVIKLAPTVPIFGHRVGKLNKTHWLCFMKE